MSLYSFFYQTAKRFATYKYYLNLWRRENLKNPFTQYSEERTRPAYILGNGPSLKGNFIEFDNSLNKADFFVVNNFAFDEKFEVYKPQYYVITDPKYFQYSNEKESSLKLLEKLCSTVNWNMILVIPYIYKDSDFLADIKKNTYISILTMHFQPYNGLESQWNKILSKGLGNAEYGTVVLNAIYTALMIGYKTVMVFGIDHNFFENIVVTEDNVLCKIDSHYYSNETQYKPLITTSIDCRPYDMELLLSERLRIFKGHKIMAGFAKYMGAEIINCTPGSFVDAYPRRKFEDCQPTDSE